MVTAGGGLSQAEKDAALGIVPYSAPAPTVVFTPRAKSPHIPQVKLRLDNQKFQNNMLNYLKEQDLKQFPAQCSLLAQLQKYGKKASFLEVLSLAQNYIDSDQYKLDKKN